jgi:predicted ferric reductase
MTLKYTLISLPSGYNFLISYQDTALLVGKIAMILFVSLMIVALYIFVKYEWFVRTMRVLGAIVFLGGYHALFVSGSDVRLIKPLFIYMVLLTSTACAVYIYRSIFHKAIKRQYKYEVVDVKDLGGVTDIHLKPQGRSLQHYAGQFAFITILDDKSVKKEEHPFTISAGSEDKNLRFCIKALGDFTETLPQLRVGTHVKVEGPYGQFSFTKMPYKKQIWIAGGIGITPFLSMAHSLPKSGFDITLYYSTKTPQEAVILNELKEIAAANGNFKVVPIVTDKQGFITAERVAKDVELKKTDVLLCGPPPMMRALSDQFQKIGVAEDHIHYEEFSL